MPGLRYRWLTLGAGALLLVCLGWGAGHRAAADPPAAVSPAVASALMLQDAFAEAAARVLPATVGVETDRGRGSGFVYDPQGRILTNNHVIAGAGVIRVRLADRRVLPATLLGSDRASDVAVLAVNAPEPLVAAELGNSDDVAVGHWAIAIGNPMGLEKTVTVGIVSAVGRVTGATGNPAQDYIQTDAAINPGNSGGPLVNVLGQVVGINNHIVSNTGTSAGIGFAVPINAARAVAEQLARDGRVNRSRLGIQFDELSPEERRSYTGLPADALPVRVSAVIDGSPAATAGLRAGDVILELDGHPIRGGADLANRVQLTPAGRTITLTIERGGQRLTVTARPAPPEERAVEVRLGIQGRALTPQEAAALGDPQLRGVLITAVEPGSPAARAGLARGQVVTAVQQTPTPDPASLAREWRRAVQAGVPPTLTVNGRAVTVPF